MWIALIVFALVMVLMSPKPQVENARASKLGDFQFPRAKEGDPVPLVWGTVRIKSPNTIWYGDFKAVPIKEKVSSGFSSKSVIVGYMYYIGLNLALCLGPNVKLKKIWAGKYLAWEGDLSAEGDFVINKPNLFGGKKKRGGLKGTVGFYNGHFSQSRDAYLTTKCNANVPRYGGVCHLVFKSFYVGTSTSIEPFNFEVQRLTDLVAPGYGVMPNGLDQNPVEILYDALTADWGRLGADSALLHIASWQSVAQTLYAENNGMSLKLESPNSGKSVAEEVLRQIDGLLYQDPETGLIRPKLLRGDYDVNTLPILDESIIKDVTNFQKTTWDSTFNQARVRFSNREKDYNDGVAATQDFGNINFQQRVRSTELSFPGCTRPDLAQQLATRALGVYSVPLYKAEFICTRAASYLRPGDVFAWSWSPFGIVKMVMRVQRIDFGELTDGKIKIVCIQDKFASNTMMFASPAPSEWNPYSDAASAVTTRKVFEAPYFFMQKAGVAPASNEGALYFAGRAPSVGSQSFDAEVSLDNWVTIYNAVFESIYGGTARLAANYANTVAADDKYDTATGMTIDLTETFTTLGTFSATLNRDGFGLFIIDNEICSYESFTNLGGGTYRLNNIRRALLGSPIESHNSGAYLFFISSLDGLGATLLGGTATVKARMMDNTATDSLDPDSAPVDTLTLNQAAFRPLPPGYFTINASRSPSSVNTGSILALAWRERDRKKTQIAFYDDATETPEAGTTYKIEQQLNGGGWSLVADNVAGSSHNYNSPGTAGTLDVRIFSKRDALLSLLAEQLSIALTAGGGGGTDTISLLHFDGTDGGTSFVDEAGLVWTSSGSPNAATTETEEKKFGTASGLFGSGRKLDTPSNASLLISANSAFTVEAFIFLTSTPSSAGIAGRWSPASWFFWFNSGNLQFRDNVNGDRTGTWTPTLNTWHHVAFARDAAGNAKMFANGAQIGSWTGYTAAPPTQTGKLTVGYIEGFSLDFPGRIDEFRFSKVCRYTGAFTPPAAPFTLD